MSRILILDREQTRRTLNPDDLLGAVRSALIASSRGLDSVPPRIAAFSPDGLLGAMPGFVPDMGLAAKLVSVFSSEGRSAHRGVVALFDEVSGELQAIMNGEPITALRTAASATVAFEVLAPSRCERLAVVGAGAQARAQLELLRHQGTGSEIVVASRTRKNADGLAAEFGVETDTIEGAVAGADVIFCCTDASEPVIDDDWIRDGAHVSSVGGSHGPELAQATISRAFLYTEWPGATAHPPAGAHELQNVSDEDVTLIGSVLCGESPRRRGDELTVFKSTGFAGLDVAAASVVFSRARATHLGTWLEL